jgi:hypothetical protein
MDAPKCRGTWMMAKIICDGEGRTSVLDALYATALQNAYTDEALERG